MSFLDCITDIQLLSAEAEKTWVNTDSIFRDHFPGFPVLPAAMMTEMGVKLSEAFVIKNSNFEKMFIPYKYSKFKFYRHAQPNQKIRIQLEKLSSDINPPLIQFKILADISGAKLFEGTVLGKLYPREDFIEKQDAIKQLGKLGVKYE